MVRTYKRKGAYLKWKEEDVQRAITSVIEGHLSTRAAASHFCVPFETLRRRINQAKLVIALGEDDEIVPKKKNIGHPTLLTKEQEQDLVTRLKSLSSRGLGCSPIGVRKAVFKYCEINNIKHPWETKGLATTL